MKPLLPRTDSYLVPIQLPVSSTVYMPPSLSYTQNKHNNFRVAKKVKIAPKVSVNPEEMTILHLCHYSIVLCVCMEGISG